MKVSFLIRKFTVLLVLSVLSLTVMNCSKKDGDDATPSGQIVGSWKITGAFVKEGNGAETDQYPILIAFFPCFKDIVITFNANSTITGTIPTACQSTADDFVGDITQSKYEIKGDQLILTENDGTQTSFKISFSGSNQMSLTDSETVSGVTTTNRIVFTKQ